MKSKNQDPKAFGGSQILLIKVSKPAEEEKKIMQLKSFNLRRGTEKLVVQPGSPNKWVFIRT